MAADASRAADSGPTGNAAPTRLDRESAVRRDDRTEVRLWLRLLTCTSLIERELGARMARDFDITLARFDALAQLERAPGGLTMGELSRRLMVTHGNVTGLVDRLVRDGLVDRRPVEGNRRAARVTLTARGRGQFRRIAAAHHAWLVELMAGARRKDLTAAMDHLAGLKRSLVDALAAAGSPAGR